MSPKAHDSLASWLSWLEQQHPSSIDLGLERVGQVARSLSLHVLNVPTIIVGGTNGKGSAVAVLEAIYKSAGFRVGAYSSPHIHRFNERVRVDGEEVSDAALTSALWDVESARQSVGPTLTYFEYTTLAAVQHFVSCECEVIVLEVGLGGRLDACNLWDADVAIITSIALDHADWLGTDLSVIATEKAAIGRSGQPLIVGDESPPDSLFELARREGMLVEHVGALPSEQLPTVALDGEHQQRNAACALAAVTALQFRLSVPQSSIDHALADVRLAGRFEVHEHDGVVRVQDVAHNPAGAEALVATWKARFGDARAEVVFAALADKDLDALITLLAPIARHWYLAPLPVPRARPIASLFAAVSKVVGDGAVSRCKSVAHACDEADLTARSQTGLVLICGSFHVLEGVSGTS